MESVGHSPEAKQRSDTLSHDIISAAIEVHRHLGPGLLESTYQKCLEHELFTRGIAFRAQVELPIQYKGLCLNAAYKLDLLVEELVIVELKSVSKLEPIFDAQLLTYLRLTQKWLGLLINFNVPLLKDGIKRLVHG
jgi:GxxExxY protein